MENKEYAGFWIRFGALLIDCILMLIVFTVPLSFIYGEQYWVGDQLLYGFWDLLLGYVAPVVATIWFWVKYLATPGKMATKLKIVDAVTGEKMSTAQAIGRYFAYIPAMLPLGLGLIWVGIDKKKQGWHDKMAGTVVIRDTAKESVSFEKTI
ncbi:RDD family protein [Oceanisphaera marina]|uniref:RDD family protein n=1 Tax=Oceanisphaera marina TaxID=2017550 RepID=A0ABQ1II90_9GAMM|nr:RDD family protein [Oceanisphaera marina]GGB42253.1 RDD family protein [Oceanisphaera marina]